MNPATVADIEARWRPLTEAEQVVAQSYLDDAWSIILASFPTIEDRLDDETLDEPLVVAVVCAMVLRVLRNPEGKRSEQIDDYRYTRDDSTATGGLFLSEHEAALLAPAEAPRDAFTIRPYGKPGYEATSWT